LKRLKVTGDNRYIQWESGEPFFILADTAWEMFHRLSKEEIFYYLETRAAQGFNTAQAVALAEFEGLTVGNAYGRLPLKNIDGAYSPAAPDTDGENSYWGLVDAAVKKAASLRMFICLLPAWGDKFNLKWGKGPEIFTPENARIYGKWLGGRYKDDWNIIWMMGGDRPLETDAHRAVISEMASGIREADCNHLITFHPMGAKSSVDEVFNQGYIDFHTIQSGHGVDTGYESYKMLRRTWETEKKPFMNSEPRYEDHPACFKPEYGYCWDGADIRMNLYWDMLEGACGHTYGNHCIWSFNREASAYFPYRWMDALHHEGAETVRWAKQLRESRDYFSLRAAPELVGNGAGLLGHIAAGMGQNYAYAYSPLGLPFTLRTGLMPSGTLKLSWFNPRTGETKLSMLFRGGNSETLVPPTQGKGQDWIAVVEAV